MPCFRSCFRTTSLSRTAGHGRTLSWQRPNTSWGQVGAWILTTLLMLLFMISDLWFCWRYLLYYNYMDDGWWMIGATIMTCSHHLSPRPSGGQRLHPLRSCDEGGIGNQTPGLTPGDHCWGWGSLGIEIEGLPRIRVGTHIGIWDFHKDLVEFCTLLLTQPTSWDLWTKLAIWLPWVVTLGPVLRPGVQGLQETHGEMPTWMSCHLSDGSWKKTFTWEVHGHSLELV